MLFSIDLHQAINLLSPPLTPLTPAQILLAMATKAVVVLMFLQVPHERLVSVNEVEPAIQDIGTFDAFRLLLQLDADGSPVVVARVTLQDIQVGKQGVVDLVNFSNNILEQLRQMKNNLFSMQVL